MDYEEMILVRQEAMDWGDYYEEDEEVREVYNPILLRMIAESKRG